MPRMQQPVHQSPLIAQQQQPLGIAVQPPDWINPRRQSKLRKRALPRHFRRELAEDVTGFVQGNEHLRSRAYPRYFMPPAALATAPFLPMTTLPADTRARPRTWPGITAGLLLLAAAGAVFFQVWRTAEPDAAVLAAQEEEKRHAEVHHAVDDFLSREAKQLLDTTQKKDLAAVQRALDSLRVCFKSYGNGIPAFTDALTGWGMRAKIVYRSSVESIERKDQHYWTASLVQEKFDEHVVSGTKLEADVMEVMKQFAYDLEADRNELLVNLETRLNARELPETMKRLALTNFREQTRSRIKEMLSKLPGQSVVVGVGSITAGIVAEEAVRQLIRAVIAQAAARIAAGAAVSGGAAAGAAATGGAGGTAIAPGVGTAVGLAGGLIVGAAVDWWMTDEFKDKVAAECRRFLTTTQVALMTGDKGLEKLLLDHVTRSHNACREAVDYTLTSAAQQSSASTP